MRRLLLALGMAVVLLLASCQTSVSIDYLYPSEVNMSAYRNLAVMPVVPYRGSLPGPTWVRGLDFMAGTLRIRSSYAASSLSRDVASYASDQLYATLRDTGYYNLLDMQMTASIVNSGYMVSKRLNDAGYDAVMIPRIESMDVDETVFSRRQSELVWDDSCNEYVSVYWYDYTVRQKASIRYSITIIDTQTERVVAQKTFVDSAERSETVDPDWPRFDGVEQLFRRMIRGFNEGLRRQFAPTVRSYTVTLMDNKPKLEAAEAAYDLSADGKTREAAERFEGLWESSHHIPSGYNAALLTASTGDFDGSLSILSGMLGETADSRVRTLYDDIRTVQRRDAEAQEQLVSAVHGTEVQIDPGISIYDYLLR